MWRPAAALVTQAREARKPLAGHYDPCCEELAARASEEMPKPETRTRGQKSPRCGAPRGARPRSQGDAGRLASAPACLASRPPVPRKHRAPVGAPPPLTGVEGWQTPGAIASRERVVL